MEAEQINVRHASDEDAAEIAAMIAAIVKEPNPVALREEMSVEQVKGWRRRLGNQGCMVYAEVRGAPAGFGALDFNTELPETGILGVWVLGEFRRRGVATALGEEILEFARENGYRRIRGRLPENNEPALSFLSGIGALVPLQNPEMRFELPL